MPIVIPPVPGIVSGAPTGAPEPETSWACTPSRDGALEYQAITLRPAASVTRLGSLPYCRPSM